MLTPKQQKILLQLARDCVESFFLEKKFNTIQITNPALLKKNGCFVSLKSDDKLRGCIGTIENNDLPLFELVKEIAIAAATEDYRFPPLTLAELKQISFEISVLTKPQIINDWQDIVLGKHGVIVEQGHNHGVFLPQVATETGWDLKTLLEELCEQKARIKRDSYKNNQKTILKIFEAQVFHE